MSKKWAIIAILGGIFLLGIIVVVVGVASLWIIRSEVTTKTIKADYFPKDINKDINTVQKDAKEFGSKSDNKGCLNEAVSREKKDKSSSGRIASIAFLKTCLPVSKASPGFCDNVPEATEESVNWRVLKCDNAGMQNDEGCQQLLSAVQEYCHQNK